MRRPALILLGLLAAQGAQAQEEPRLGAPLPTMETVICYTARGAQAFMAMARRRGAMEGLPASCVQTLVIAIPQEIPAGLGSFETAVKTYAPGAATCVEHRIEEVTRRVPVILRRQPVRFVESHAIYEDGSPQDMRALVLLPQRPYALEFLADPNRRDAAGPCG